MHVASNPHAPPLRFSCAFPPPTFLGFRDPDGSTFSVPPRFAASGLDPLRHPGVLAAMSSTPPLASPLLKSGMHVASSPHDPRFQNPCALFPIFMLRDILRPPQRTAVVYSPNMAAENPNKKRKATLDAILSTVERGFADLEGKMERGFAAVAEDITDIKSKMATKDDIANLGGQLTSVERELKSIRRDLDDLREKVENVSGFQKEIDHALERIAAIEKHLGINKKIAA
jgi:hypothetical protein